MRNKEYYLKEGPLTYADEEVSRVASNVTAEGAARIESVLSEMPKLEFVDLYMLDRKKFMKWHQKRTAEKILRSKVTCSCGDNAIVFCAIARKAGIPTRYIQAVEKKGGYGHVYCECYLNGDVYLTDPTALKYWKMKEPIKLENPFFINKHPVVVAFDGLDNVEAGIKDHEALLKVMNEAVKRLPMVA